MSRLRPASQHWTQSIWSKMAGVFWATELCYTSKWILRKCRFSTSTWSLRLGLGIRSSVFDRIDESDSLRVDLFIWSTRAIRSRSIFLKYRRERFDHVRSFLKVERLKDRNTVWKDWKIDDRRSKDRRLKDWKIERSKIERLKDWIPNTAWKTRGRNHVTLYENLCIYGTSTLYKHRPNVMCDCLFMQILSTHLLCLSLFTLFTYFVR